MPDIIDYIDCRIYYIELSINLVFSYELDFWDSEQDKITNGLAYLMYYHDMKEVLTQG